MRGDTGFLTYERLKELMHDTEPAMLEPPLPDLGPDPQPDEFDNEIEPSDDTL